MNRIEQLTVRNESQTCLTRRARFQLITARSGYPPLTGSRRSDRGFRLAQTELTMKHCPNCGGTLQIIAILEQHVIEKFLSHLGRQARAPPRAPARGQAVRVAQAQNIIAVRAGLA